MFWAAQFCICIVDQVHNPVEPNALNCRAEPQVGAD